MIFKTVTSLETKSEKNLFIELVEIYTRLVEVYCEKNNLYFGSKENIDISEELIEMGVINSNNEIVCLKNFLKKDYEKFEKAVCTVVNHKEIRKKILYKLYNSERKDIQKKSKNNKKTIVDFFCGAGGLSLGFVQNGFRIVLSNDIEEVCINTYRFNHPDVPSDKVIQGDIKNIVDNIGDYIDEPIDIVVGGPPCQGFSEANRQRVIDDPRNHLYKYFVKAIEKIAPKFVVMENVKGMLKVADQVVEDYHNIKVEVESKICTYKIAYRILNSSDFSVAQSRERLIYIAIRSDVAEEKNILPTQIFDQIEESVKINKKFNLEDALADIDPLEAPREKNMTNVDSDLYGKKISVNHYAENDNEYLKLINLGRKIEYVFNHKARYCNDINYEIYKRLNPGDDATDEKIKDIMPYANRNHCFKDKYYKLIPDRPCRTITAHLRMDCHSHIHPFQIRSLTPREAARVQSFPDDYLFLGAYLKTYMQVGNAVPPMMARGIANIIKDYL